MSVSRGMGLLAEYKASSLFHLNASKNAYKIMEFSDTFLYISRVLAYLHILRT